MARTCTGRQSLRDIPAGFRTSAAIWTTVPDLLPTRRSCAELPQVRVIGLSMFTQGEQARPMLDAGAVAYVNKTDSVDVLLTAIRRCDGTK